MKTLKIPFLVIVGWAQPQACAADIPAGTTILIRTTKNIISTDPRDGHSRESLPGISLSGAKS
jgi:hypothetical protein